MPETDAINFSVAEDLALLEEVGQRAGQLALDWFHRGAEAKSWDKAPGHIVSEADLAVNTFLHEELLTARPDYGWLSEESSHAEAGRRADVNFIIDPIDGTTAFLNGEPDWCVALAIERGGKVQAGVLVAPVTQEVYSAGLGLGAFYNWQAISVKPCAKTTDARLIINRAPFARLDWTGAERIQPKPCATLLRLAYLASGRADGVVALGLKADWDLAAGALLVEEAGGILTTHLGEVCHYNRALPAQRSLVAASKPLHALLVKAFAHIKVPLSQERFDKIFKDTGNMPQSPTSQSQLLHLVIGGELKKVSGIEFEDMNAIDFVGAYGSYAEAYNSWKNAAQRTVDNAEMRYFIIHAHKLLDPETGTQHKV